MNDNYLNLTVEALATDPDVKAYVLTGEQTAAWESWLEAHPSEAVKMMKVQRQLLQNQKKSIAAVVEPSRLEEAFPEKRVRGIRGWVQRKEWGKVMLVTAISLGSLFYLYTINFGGELYKTKSGEQRIVALPDGSKAHLAPESILRVKYGEDLREVNLAGDAFFEVKEGMPFTVNTSEGKLEVVGTSFSVEARNALLVACATGKVKVTRKTDETVLTSGFAVSNTAVGLSKVSSIPIDAIAPWRSGRLLLKGLSVAEVAKNVERYYSRGFKVENSLRTKKINVEIPTSDFPLAIERINFALQMKVDTNQRIFRTN